MHVAGDDTTQRFRFVGQRKNETQSQPDPELSMMRQLYA